ncbi:MAG: hypothetical protein ACLR53_06905 [Evtepia gabavorous]
MQRAVNVGAVIKTAVSRKTDFLVVGRQYDGPGGTATVSNKEEKARAILAEEVQPLPSHGSRILSSFTGLSAPYFACRTPRRRNKTLIKNAVDLCAVVHGVLFNV